MHKYRSLFAWQQAHKIAVLALTKCDSASRLAAELEYLPDDVTREMEAVLERAMAALHGLLRKPITTAR